MQETTENKPKSKSNRKIIRLGMTGETRDRIKSLAKKSGYGPKQTNKFLNRVLTIVDDLPSLFSKKF
jgi:DNA-binding LacI/PurR family transcriptional regulator